jgi:hypothetical protein
MRDRLCRASLPTMYRMTHFMEERLDIVPTQQGRPSFLDGPKVRGDNLQPGWAAGKGPGLESEGVSIKGRDGRYQLPIVVLTTDFGTVEEGRPALLSWNDIGRASRYRSNSTRQAVLPRRSQSP